MNALIIKLMNEYTGWPPPQKKKKKKKKKKTEQSDTVDFSGICSDQQLSCFHLAG